MCQEFGVGSCPINVISSGNAETTSGAQFDEKSGQVLLESDKISRFIAYGIGATIFGGAATRSGKQLGAK